MAEFHTYLTPENGYLFRITHEINLPFILQHGLVCPNHPQKDPRFRAIANPNVDEKRESRPVPISPGGVLHDYVPFYFAPCSPMLYSNYKQGHCPQEEIIYLSTKAELVAEARLAYCFTDGHAIITYSQYYNTLEDLAKVDWAIMRAKYWHNSDEEYRRRMAEFLVKEGLPLTLIRGIGVKTDAKKEQVESLLRKHEIAHIVVKVQPSWYF